MGSSAQLAGDPAHLEFQLWLMTQQIEPVIFRHDVSCPFSPRKQPPASKTAVSQWCSPFSPSRGKAGAAGLGVRGAALGAHHPGEPHPEDPSFPHKLAGSGKSMRNNFSLTPWVLGSWQGSTRLGLLHRRGSCMAKIHCQRPWHRNICA